MGESKRTLQRLSVRSWGLWVRTATAGAWLLTLLTRRLFIYQMSNFRHNGCTAGPAVRLTEEEDWQT